MSLGGDNTKQQTLTLRAGGGGGGPQNARCLHGCRLLLLLHARGSWQAFDASSPSERAHKSIR